MIQFDKFLKEYGDVSFDDQPFCDVDAIILCNIFYNCFEQVVPDGFETRTNLPRMCYKMYAYNGYRHKGSGLILNKNISIAMMSLTACRRYKDIEVTGVRHIYEKNPATQFDAMTLILPSGQNVIIYEGTDDTLAGWKEDVDMLTKGEIPSHKLTLDYLSEAFDSLDGDFYIAGHSKGGHLALYAGLYSTDEQRKRIIRLYNLEGPGFVNHDFLESDAYKELLPKYVHIVPQSAMFGMLLAHDYDFKVVKSTRIFGLLQHDLATWKTNGYKIYTQNDVTNFSKIFDLVMYNVIDEAEEEHLEALDETFTALIDASECVGLMDFAKTATQSVPRVIKAAEKLPEEQKDKLKDMFKDVGKYAECAFRDICKNGLNPKDLILS